MAAKRAPDEQRRVSVTMYDPARDIYTVSDGPAERKVHPSQSQEPRLDEAGTIGPAAGQGKLFGPLGRPQGVLGHSSAAKAISPSQEQIPREKSAESGNTRNNKPTLSTPSLARTQESHRLSLPSDPSMTTASRSSSPVVTVNQTVNDAEHVSSRSVKPQASDSNMQGNGDSSKVDVQKPASSEKGQVAAHTEKRDRVMDGSLVDGAIGKEDSSSPQGTAKAAVNRRSEQPDRSETQKPDQDAPRTKRKRLEERTQKNRKRAKVGPSAYSRRDDSIPAPENEIRQSSSPSRRSPGIRHANIAPPRSPSPIRRSPSPGAEPVRQRKRPGGGARVSSASIEAWRRRQEERERQQLEEAKKVLSDRGVHDVVRQHYNAVPERGREWRRTDSKIKGLRSFNNWVKSTLIHKFSPDEDFLARTNDNSWASQATTLPEEAEKRLLVVDLGCGKGGDLGKWHQAPQAVELYVGLDPAEISIEQARDRYMAMRRNRGPRRGNPLFHAEFYPKDCFGEWLGDVPIVKNVGIDPNVGPGGSLMASRWGGGGFDVAVCMFTMHYAFESEEKARQMLANVAGVLKKGGRFIGVGPNSDVISAKVVEFHKKKKAQEVAAKQNQEEREDGEVEDIPATPEWGNSIYRVRFPSDTPEDGVFRPPFGWKYFYFMEEAVEEIPEYVVPWEAFRALTEDYNLELQYRKPFLDVWREEKDDPILGPLSERMGVRSKTDGSMLVTDEELEAASFYHAFCFYKV
ncbi:hypothetical protein VTO42DRAFT_8278 [Malbranchea cinnamomea]